MASITERMMADIGIFTPIDMPVAEPSLKSAPTKPPTTVLVCEDEALIRLYLVDLLEELGYAVVEADNGASAIERMSTMPIDFLITDLGLPDMSGAELARRLRTRWPLLPILFATGRGPEGAGLSDGNTGYLAKPFTVTTVETALADLLARGAHRET